MKKVVAFFLTVLISNFIFSQVTNPKSAQDVLQERGEVYFKFSLPEDKFFRENISLISGIISIDNVKDNEITAYANVKEFGKFLNFDIEFEVLTPPSMLHKSILENASLPRNTDAWDYYPSYDQYLAIMNQFEADYPGLCEVVNIGYSTNGRELLFIHINDSLGVHQNEPEFMYTSSIHGDEVVGYVLMLRYIDYLLQNYGSDPYITNLVNNIDIWINPLANPDGTYAGGNNSVWGATRNNANNVDLNRNYADPEDGPHPDGNAYQDETLAFMDFSDENDFVISSNFHGGAEVLNYPWDTWAQLAADDDWWIYVCREYVDTVHVYGPSGYFTGFNNGITNGYAWYSISGGRQDYMNYFHNCREMTLEISNIKMPPENQLPGFWEYNYRSLLGYMKQSLNGFSGIITNAMNGNPVMAKVFVEDHDIDNSWVFSHQPVGDYHRPIKEGTYDVTFSAFGYYDKTIVDVEIIDNSNLILNVELTPNLPLTADFYATPNIVGVGNSVDFYDNSWGNNIVSWNWTFAGGNPETSSDEDPVGIGYENIGDYDVTLTVSDINGNSDTKFQQNFITVKEAFNMNNENITTCDALFYDSGGENADYSNDEDFTMTFFAGTTNSSIKLEFIGFNIENHFYCDYDYMEIFDGSDVNAPLIGKWCGTNNPGTVIASNEEGALTVYFYSNNLVTKPGWKALVSCDSNVGITQTYEPDIKIYPNPASTEVTILFDGEIRDIVLSDMLGRQVYHADHAIKYCYINISDFERGIYLLSFNYKGSSINRKLIVN
ncbi:MAG: T9SS type A sorting domain-containing protein [Bacteroidetes bacterium]|nr:T9SS type A sorting domain-containing protein [Bacteroidota bacterium]MBL6942940.1 T9SS type A sorting domain-containing protein [Bacteroidales bacterium]